MKEYTAPHEKFFIKEADSDTVKSLARQLNVSEVVARLLVNRKLTTYDECKKYFRPEISHFHDPLLFKDMDSAVKRIVNAIEAGEKIVVHGDYDVDGVTATVLLVSALRRMGALCEYYLPNRLTEGYGISSEGVEEIHRKKGSLIITVDCGISACKAIAYAKNIGIDVIVTDHHEVHGKLPDAFAVLNPKVEGCTYPYKYLAGVGVALKLVQALSGLFGTDESLWLDYLDLASIGTAADIVPLTGENRLIAKLGFEKISDTKNTGLKQVIKQRKLDSENISTSDVVFMIAPCINAAGRLGDQYRCVKLLLTDDNAEAALYARDIIEMNRERQALDKHVQEKAFEWILQNVDLGEEFAIVAADKDWHVGVIGISASKVVEKFCRPAFLFSIGEDGIAKGSGRSVKGLNLFETLEECEDLLESFGGHKAAAGASIKVENLSAFRKRFSDSVKKRISMEELIPKVYTDVEVKIDHLNSSLFNILKQMEPFGPGNMRPVFLCRELKNRYAPRIVGKNHLKMTVESKGRVMDAIAFNFGERFNDIEKADRFSLAFSLDENEWNGRVNLQMKVKGIEA